MVTPDQFWSRVQKSDACWEYRGFRTEQGYGRVSWNGRPVGAHRISWMLTSGPIPDGICVLHRCDNPPCVRPDHLFLGTRADNSADMVAKGRYTRRFLRGQEHPQATLSDTQVLAIRDALAAGVEGKRLAYIFGVTPSAVSEIKLRKTWSHLAERRCEDVLA